MEYRSHIRRDVSLRALNTFGVEARAQMLAEIGSIGQLQGLLSEVEGVPLRVLGGGSNVLLRGDVDGLVLLDRIPGVEVVRREGTAVWVAAGGGLDWHALVEWTLEHGLSGLENLSLIPGTVGAAPIQNIGAYGVELCEVFEALEAVELSTGRCRIFTGEECAFGYRDSIFKRSEKGRWFITRVVLRLSSEPRLNLSYGALQETLREMGVQRPTPRDVSRAVIRIRRSKLPDPARLGNAGSFFKNPELPAETFRTLQRRHPDLPGYPLPDGRVKVPAAWLIERAGWKGRREGAVGCHERQPLVIVHFGGGTGEAIWHFARQVQRSVEERFGIRLVPEVNVW